MQFEAGALEILDADALAAVLLDDDIADRQAEDGLAAMLAPVGEERPADGLLRGREPLRVGVLRIGRGGGVELAALRRNQLAADRAERDRAAGRRTLHAGA